MGMQLHTAQCSRPLQLSLKLCTSFHCSRPTCAESHTWPDKIGVFKFTQGKPCLGKGNVDALNACIIPSSSRPWCTISGFLSPLEALEGPKLEVWSDLRSTEVLRACEHL